MKTKREQILKMAEGGNKSFEEIGNSLKPPLSKQRVEQIMNGNPDWKTTNYRSFHRHQYHVKIEKKFEDCERCFPVQMKTETQPATI
jgi:hypothetical protein